MISPLCRINTATPLAKSQEGEHKNCISFSHSCDVRAPVNTPGQRQQHWRLCPWALASAGSVLICKCGMRIKHGGGCITDGKLVRGHMIPGKKKRLMFTAAPHCNFQGRQSVEACVETCTRWGFDAAFGGVYELRVVPALRHRWSLQAQTFIKQVNKNKNVCGGQIYILRQISQKSAASANGIYKWGPALHYGSY